MRNVKESEVLARYMVEDNYEDYVDLNYNRSISMKIVRSIFRKFMGFYCFSGEAAGGGNSLEEIENQVH